MTWTIFDRDLKIWISDSCKMIWLIKLVNSTMIIILTLIPSPFLHLHLIRIFQSFSSHCHRPAGCGEHLCVGSPIYGNASCTTNKTKKCHDVRTFRHLHNVFTYNSIYWIYANGFTDSVTNDLICLVSWPYYLRKIFNLIVWKIDRTIVSTFKNLKR